MAQQHLVVVGASLAGLRAVESAREAGFEGTITLIGAEEHPPYDRPALSKAFLESGTEPTSPLYREAAELRDQLRVDLVLGRPATGLDVLSRSVWLDDIEVHYDKLVITTGVRARNLPGAQRLDGVYTLRSLDDAWAIRHALARARRAVVVGAGFIGSEVASSARKRGVEVTLVEAAPTPLGTVLGNDLARVCSRLHTTNGVDLRLGTTVTRLEGDTRVEGAVLSDGTQVDADVVVVGVGAVPAVEWLTGSGITLRDGVVCDETLETNIEGVYAAGDVARWYNPLFQRHMRVEHWTNAAEQGAIAARNAVGPGREVCATVPYFWSDWYGTRIQFAGVPGGDASVVLGDPDLLQFVALYRSGDRLTGVLALNRRGEMVRYRALIRKRASWDEALDFATRRTAGARDLVAG